MTADTRRTTAAWTFQDAESRRNESGTAEGLIDDAGLGVGPVRIAFLDADSLALIDHKIEIGLWPEGRLTLSGLGRRFETFSKELKQARNQARVAGLLAHAPAMPAVFQAELLVADSRLPVEVRVYPTHVTFVPGDADPWQLPFGALQDIALRDDPPSVAFVGPGKPIIVGQLGRMRDPFHRAVTAARDGQARILKEYTGRDGFADGLGLPKSRMTGFEYLLDRCSSPERLSGAKTMIASATGDPRIGFVQMLDPDEEMLRAKAELPTGWASLLLAPVNTVVVFEILAGPNAATYVFEGEIEAINRDLQQLHFRRAGLALTDAEAEVAPDNPHRLALRRLEPLRRLRAATRRRIVHNDDWQSALENVVVPDRSKQTGA